MKKTTKNILTRLAYLVFAGLFMTLVVSAKVTRDQQVVRDLSITIDHHTGNFFITEEDVKASVQEFLPTDGAPLLPKDLKDFEDLIEELPAVQSANVFVNNIGQLSIDVHQRSPLYRIISKTGKTYYVDEAGYKFPTSEKHTAKVPIVTGFVKDNGKQVGQVATSMHEELLLLFRTFKEDEFLKAQFGQVDVTEKGEFELIPRVGNHVVQIGNTEDLDAKLLRLRIFYREGLPHAGWDTYRTINVKYRDQVVCKK